MGAKQTRVNGGMTDLEKRFATLYLESFNATDAYIAANTRKVTRKTAENNGYRLLQRPDIQEFVRQQRDKLLAEAELTVAETLTKLRQMLMYDVRHMYDKADGSMLAVTELPDELAAAVIGIKQTQWGVEYKFVDRSSVLEKALKYHGLFDKDNKQRTDPLTEVLNHIYVNGSRLTPKP